MFKFNMQLYLLLLLSVIISQACSNELSGEGSIDGDYGNDGDNSSDTDTDIDSDNSADLNLDSESGNGYVPPEVEKRFDYRVPVSSGKYVFIADKENDTVVAVNSETLVINLTDVGASPTHIVPINDNGSIAVLSVDSNEVSLLSMNDKGVARVTVVDVRADTNALAVSPSGRYIIAFWDGLFKNESTNNQTDQDITIIDTQSSKKTAHNMIVGIHPLKIIFNKDETSAFAVTQEGVNIINLKKLSTEFMPKSVALFDYTIVDQTKTEIAIDPSGTIAIGRQEESKDITVAWLDGSDKIRRYTLNAIPTDIDISNNGLFGMFTSRFGKQVALFNLPLPDDETEDPFKYVDIGETVAGAATISNDDKKVALYTTVGDVDRNIVTILTQKDSKWIVKHSVLSRNVSAVICAPDSKSLIAVHNKLNATELSTGSSNKKYSYSLIKLPDLQTKFQQTDMKPEQILLTPDGDYAYLIFADKSINIINLNSFIVDSILLGSVPVIAGYASLTNKIFIAQKHPSGRMSFMNTNGTGIKTVTGYTLNDDSEDF